MRRLLLILLSSLLCGAAVFALTACGGNEKLVAEFNEDIEDAYACYKQEFDIEPFIKKQDGVKYTVYADQIDSTTLDTVELEVNGFKFTPIINEEVWVRFTAEKGSEKVTSKEIKLYVEINAEEVVQLFNISWADEYMSKDINLDERYIKTGARTSTKVQWFGKESKIADRFQYFASLMGNDITDCYSVTDWSDAVITFWVYNPTDYEIEIAPIWSHNDWIDYNGEPELDNDGKDYKNDNNVIWYSEARTIQTAAPNAWTEIKYSMRYYGMTSNFYYDDDVFRSYANTQVSYGTGYDNKVGKNRMNQNFWTSRWGGRKPAGQSYAYSFYVDGFDIRNYDAQKDAGLDHEYNGYLNQIISKGEGSSIAVLNNDGSTYSFEYKIVSDDGEFSVALLGDDWGSNYYGYFTFDSNGMVDEYIGVTVMDSDNGYKKVVFDLEAVNIIQGAQKPQIIKVLYVNANYNNADVIVKDCGI